MEEEWNKREDYNNVMKWWNKDEHLGKKQERSPTGNIILHSKTFRIQAAMRRYGYDITKRAIPC